MLQYDRGYEDELMQITFLLKDLRIYVQDLNKMIVRSKCLKAYKKYMIVEMGVRKIDKQMRKVDPRCQ
jgi:hypothetical protein